MDFFALRQLICFDRDCRIEEVFVESRKSFIFYDLIDTVHYTTCHRQEPFAQYSNFIFVNKSEGLVADLFRSNFIYFEYPSKLQLDMYQCIASIDTFQILASTTELMSMNSFAYLSFLFLECNGRVMIQNQGEITRYYLPTPSLIHNQYIILIGNSTRLEFKLYMRTDPVYLSKDNVDFLNEKILSLPEDLRRCIFHWYTEFRTVYGKEFLPTRVENYREYVYLDTAPRTHIALNGSRSIGYPYVFERTIRIKDEMIENRKIQIHCDFLTECVCIILFIHSKENYFHPDEFDSKDPIDTITYGHVNRIMNRSGLEPEPEPDRKVVRHAILCRNLAAPLPTTPLPIGMYCIPFTGSFDSKVLRRTLDCTYISPPTLHFWIQFNSWCDPDKYYITMCTGRRCVVFTKMCIAVCSKYL